MQDELTALGEDMQALVRENQVRWGITGLLADQQTADDVEDFTSTTLGAPATRVACDELQIHACVMPAVNRL